MNRLFLTKPNLDVLKELSFVKVLKDNALLVHSTPKEPKAWHYLLTLSEAEINFHYFEQKSVFLGHSHYPFIIERLLSGGLMLCSLKIMLKSERRKIYNKYRKCRAAKG